MNRYLVITAGSPRGGEATWDSLYENVLNPLNADLAIATSKDYVDESLSLFKKAKYTWIFEDYGNYFEYYSKNYSEKSIEYLNRGINTGLYESGSIHFVFKDFILKNYLTILDQYDFIIYTRFDQFYLTKHYKGKKGKILIPEGEDYFGICDRHAVIPKEFIKKYLEICQYIDSDNVNNYHSEYLNCETTYMNQLKDNNLIDVVERVHRYQFTSSLKKDKTNWRIGVYKLYGFKKLYTKYPDEFMDSFKNIITFKKSYLFKLNKFLILNYFYLNLRRKLGSIKDIFNHR
jgi:hypothetical protein